MIVCVSYDGLYITHRVLSIQCCLWRNVRVRIFPSLLILIMPALVNFDIN